jgi:hypothetical protein
MTLSRHGELRASPTLACASLVNSIIPWLAARAFIHELRPELDDATAGQQASAAIHYASLLHAKWLWHRVGDANYWNDDAAKVAISASRIEGLRSSGGLTVTHHAVNGQELAACRICFLVLGGNDKEMCYEKSSLYRDCRDGIRRDGRIGAGAARGATRPDDHAERGDYAKR